MTGMLFGPHGCYSGCYSAAVTSESSQLCARFAQENFMGLGTGDQKLRGPPVTRDTVD